MSEKAPEPAVRLVGHPWRIVVYVVFLLAATWFMARVVAPASGRLTHGFGAYYSASRLLSNGTYSAQVYEPAYFRRLVRADSYNEVEDVWPNPPPTTLMLAPIAGLPVRAARVAWTIYNVPLLFAGLSLLIRTFAPRAPQVVWLLVFTAAMLFRPVIANFIFGQAYILVFSLLVLAVVGLYQRKDLIGGASLGLALTLKLVGWPLGFALIRLRRWRLLAAYAATVIFVAMASLPVFGLTSWQRFAAFLSSMTRSPLVCVTAYQTTRSWLCHLFAPQVVWQEVDGLTAPWPVTATLAAAGLVTLALLLTTADRQPMTAIVGLIAWGVLFAPLGEEHHHVVLLIPIVWLFLGWWTGRPVSKPSLLLLALALALYMMPFWINDPRLQQGWLALLAYPRLYAAWLVLAALLLSHQRPGASVHQPVVEY